MINEITCSSKWPPKGSSRARRTSRTLGGLQRWAKSLSLQVQLLRAHEARRVEEGAKVATFKWSLQFMVQTRGQQIFTFVESTLNLLEVARVTSFPAFISDSDT